MKLIIYMLFFISGPCGLIYELVWWIKFSHVMEGPFHWVALNQDLIALIDMIISDPFPGEESRRLLDRVQDSTLNQEQKRTASRFREKLR